MTTFVAWDTETTGLTLPSVITKEAQPRIIDFAAIKLSRTTGEEVARYQTLINPECALPSEITKITGYTDADLCDAPRFAEVLPGIIDFFLGTRSMLSHNLPFDKAMLRYELERLDRLTSFPWPPQQLCSVAMYATELGKRPRLTDLYERIIGKKLDQTHTAMDDTEALVAIVRKERLYEL